LIDANGNPVIVRIASTLIANQFMRYCYQCGGPIVFRPNKKGNKPRWLKMEYPSANVLHVCTGTKEDRLKELNRRGL